MNKILFKNIDGSAIIVFRILFGFLVACESFGTILTGWVKNVFILSNFSFSFIGFEWLQPLPGYGMYYYFSIMGLTGLGIMLGYRYRLNIILFTILWSGVYFMQKSSYNNHYYLLVLISFLMIFIPANQEKSLDTKFGYTQKKHSIPNWIQLLFIIMISIVYVYAAIAKLYPDWLNGTFTRNLLSGTDVSPFFQNLFSKKWFYLFIAYSGIAFDLLIIPFLLYKRTRTVALIATFIFHIFNSITLKIGIFPYFALGFALFFYDPKKIRKIFFKEEIEIENTFNFYGKKIVYFLVMPFIILQLLLPLRHHLIEGDVLWTEEGHRLSWRMMLRERSGFIIIKIKDNKTHEEKIYNYHENLTVKQAHQLAVKPDFIWQYCQRIKEEYKGKDISIYINCRNSINRKAHQVLIDPDYDMAKAEWNFFKHNEWILLHD